MIEVLINVARSRVIKTPKISGISGSLMND